ncbi:hypothetical protein [Chamaesiphon sp. OTE_8_metabat_110]|uniref:hypothetical protein n=1 Tax=Chamaesiphon sp. OTE_8_metabat_110 TaxID=2964696 RepID=UPI00286B8A2E|nr:hypothetical protein [Chamaesiphon sp. OTE_8_metabat_110]
MFSGGKIARTKALNIDRFSGMTSSNDDSNDTIWVNGYHGTSRSRADKIIAEGFQPSTNGYDWLGTGVYFWQDAPNHALHWAQKMYSQEPAVIKSRLRLDSTCLDLLDMPDTNNTNFWMDSYNKFIEVYQQTGKSLPTQNPDIPGKRYLDCAFFDYLISTIERSSEPDSLGLIRSAFVEGHPNFPNSAICDKTHVQISVIKLDLIEHSFIYQG